MTCRNGSFFVATEAWKLVFRVGKTGYIRTRRLLTVRRGPMPDPTADTGDSGLDLGYRTRADDGASEVNDERRGHEWMDD